MKFDKSVFIKLSEYSNEVSTKVTRIAIVLDPRVKNILNLIELDQEVALRELQLEYDIYYK